jgi:hypothetical protein
MKKAFFIIILAAVLASCANNSSNTSPQVDSLQKQVAVLKEKYTPGLGEIMLGIQMHHAKLWFAGVNNNRALAGYELDELKEMAEAAKTMENERPEVKSIPMLYPAIDSLAQAIKTHNTASFKSGFLFLTGTCNNCHTIHHFEFNVITVPSAPPVTNQVFTVQPPGK